MLVKDPGSDPGTESFELSMFDSLSTATMHSHSRTGTLIYSDLAAQVVIEDFPPKTTPTTLIQPVDGATQ